jgi:hypothetical protein
MLEIAACYFKFCLCAVYVLFEAPPRTKTSWLVDNSLRLSVAYLFFCIVTVLNRTENEEVQRHFSFYLFTF